MACVEGVIVAEYQSVQDASTCRSSGVKALEVSVFTVFWFSAIIIFASGNMKYGSAEVMWPTKVGEAVCTDSATTLRIRNSACSETNTGSSGMCVSVKSFSMSLMLRRVATMCSRRKPCRLADIPASRRARVESGASTGTVKMRCSVSSEAWRSFAIRSSCARWVLRLRPALC